MRTETDLVVLIDDEPAVLQTLQMILERFGVEVLAAPSAHDALTALADTGKTPDLIVADYRLADGEVGTDAIRQIQQAAGAAIPGIIITGDTSPDRIQEAQESGFRILHKPVPINTLKSEIFTALEPAR